MLKKLLLITLSLIAAQPAYAMEEDRDRIAHDFLHDHETFQKLWKTRSALPVQMSKLLAQKIIAPALTMLKNKITPPCSTMQEESECTLDLVPFNAFERYATPIHHPTTNIYAIRPYEPRVEIYDSETNQILHTLNHYNLVPSLRFNRKGNLALTCDEEPINTVSQPGVAKIWDITTGTCLRTLRGHMHRVQLAEFNQEENQIVTVSAEATWKIWDAANGTCLLTVPWSGYGKSIQFNKTGDKIVLSCHSKPEIQIWDIGNYFAAIKFLEKDITLEQAMLVNCINKTALINQALEKCGKIAKNKFDFNKFPHLQQYFTSLPETIQQALSEYVILQQETNDIHNSNN